MTEYEKNFPFRGKINEYRGNDIGKSFYMVGKFTEEGASESYSTGIFKNSGFTTKQELMDQNFILCSNQYHNENGYQQRLYFSSDPHDYQIDKSNNSLNQGAANLTYTQNEGNFNLKYMTYFSNGNSYKSGSWRDVPENLNQIPISNQIKPEDFNFNNTIYNLDNSSLYYSVPYEIKKIPKNNSSVESLNFTFRGISHSTTLGSSTYFPETSFSGTCFHYSNVEKIEIYEGTSIAIEENPNFTDNYTITIPISNLETNQGVCVLTDYHFKKNNVLKIENTTDSSDVSEYVFYESMEISGSNVVFNITQRALYNGSSIPPTGDSGVSRITSELRNTKSNFGPINSSYLNYYLIPYEAYGYFTRGLNLSHFAETKKTGEENLKYFDISSTYTNNIIYDSIVSGNSETSDLTDLHNINLDAYQKFYNYFVFLTSGKLNSIWQNKTASSVLGINSSTQLTNFTWAVSNEAYQAFMYNYCTKNPYETCGSCFGLNEYNQEICHVTNESRGIITGQTKSLQGKPPLNHTEDNHAKDSVPRVLYFWWFFAMILILICYMFYIVYKIFNIKDYGERKKYNITNPLFEKK